MPKLWYDPRNPKMLTEEQILRMTPQEMNVAMNQLDQNIVNTLLSIDQGFSDLNRKLTEVILPNVAQYGEHSKEIWDSIKFWRSFFEAAANTRINRDYAASDEGDSFAPGNQSDDQTLRHDQSSSQPPAPEGSSQQQQQQGNDSLSFEREHNSQDDEPSFLRDDSENGESIVAAAAAAAREKERELQQQQAKGKGKEKETATSRVKATATSSSTPRGSSKKGGSDAPWSADLSPFNLLEKDMSRLGVGVGVAASPNLPRKVPGSKSAPPLSLDDLSLDTPPVFKRTATASSRAQQPVPSSSRRPANSPPISMHYSLPRSKFVKTPAKEAAALVKRDVYEAFGYTEDSPEVEPPSVLRNWATRGYDKHATGSGGREGGRRGFEEEELVDSSDEDSEDDNAPYMGGAAFPGAETGNTARLDTLLGDDDELGGGAGTRFAGLEDDSGGSSSEEEIGRDAEISRDDDVPLRSASGTGAREDDLEFSYVEEEDSLLDRPVRGLAEGPEDTLFGVAGGQQGQGQGFRIRGMEDMHTFHGGQLLESEPFQGSPLAGKDR